MTRQTVIQILGIDDLSPAAQSAAKSLAALGGAVSNAGGAAGSVTGAFGSLSSGLSGVMTVAAGIISANVFGRITDGLMSFAKTGLDAVGTQQQLSTSLNALLTSNNMYAQSTETVTTAVTKQIMSQGEYGLKLDELNAKLVTQKATYQEQAEKIRQMTLVYGENGLNVLKLKAQHEQLEVAIQKTQKNISGLSTTTTKYGTETKNVYKEVMNQADAFKLAGKQTQDLLSFISKLAVVSPFETEDVEVVTKYAIAAGMGVDATKEFVPAFLDLSGAVGITSSELGFAADQLLQVKKVGKLTEIDLRQLRRIGIDLGKVIGVEMGMSVEEFNAKAEKSPEIFDQLFAAITKFSQNTFAGTSKAMATSVKGLQSTINDIFVIGARTFFAPLVNAVTPAISGVIGNISDAVLGGGLESIGQQAAGQLMQGMAQLEGLFRVFSSGGMKAGVQYLLQQMGFTQASIGVISGWIEQVKQTLSVFNSEGFFGAGGEGGLLRSLGLSNESVAVIQSAIGQIQGLFSQFMASLSGAGGAETLNSIGNAFTLIGTTGIQALNTILPVLGQLSTWLTANIPMAVKTVTDLWNQYWPTVSAGLTTAWTVIQAVFTSMVNTISASLGPAITQVGGVFSSMGINWQSVGNALLQATQIVFAGIGAAILAAVSVLTGLISASVSAFSAIIVAFQSFFIQLSTGIAGIQIFINSFMVFWQKVFQGDLPGALQAVSSGLTGLIVAFTGFTGSIIAILTGMGSTVLAFFSGFTNSIVGFWQNLFNTLVGHSIIPDMVAKIVEVLTGENWLDIGASMINGILEGIQKNQAQVWELLKNMAKQAIAEAKKAIGFGSPARQFIPIGESMLQGLMTGIDTTSKAFNNKLSKALQNAIDLSNELVKNQVSGNQRQSVRNLFSSWIQNNQDKLSGLTGEKLKTYISQYASAWGSNAKYIMDQMVAQGYDFEAMAQELNTTYSSFMRELRLSAAGSSLSTAGTLLGVGQAAADRLQNQINTLQSLVAAGGGEYLGTVYSAVDAQTLLNDKLAEQLSVQKQINELSQQQADLQFLQQQVSLLTTVQNLGLDPKDVFSGITFGLNASLPDLIAATSNVVKAMITQVSDDLEIASPSKVMARIGKQVTAGLAQGIQNSKDTATAAMGLLKPDAGTVTGGVTNSQSNTTWNFNINSSQPGSSLYSDYKLIRAVVGSG